MSWSGFIAAAIVLLLVVLFVRMFLFRSLQKKEGPSGSIQIDTEKAANRLAGAVRIPTLSFNEGKEVDREPFKQFRDYLAAQFPQAYQTLKHEIVADDSLLYTWEGSNPELKPILLLAHSDVVPAIEEIGKEWTHKPFSGDVAEGFIWGRGSLDDKVSALGILEAIDYLVAQGLKPERTILLAIGHDEEIGGLNGAKNVSKVLSERGVQVEYILDEGGVVIDGMMGNLSLATVGIAEKGYVTLKLSVEGTPGHSSQPPAHTSIGILSAAIQRIESHPRPLRVGGVMAAMLRYLGPEMPFLNRLMLANTWLFGPLVARTLAKQPAMNAMMRTTSAVTLISGGTKDNILPATATTSINCRILPGETVQGTMDYIREQANDPRVNVEIVSGFCNEPSPVSSVDSPVFNSIQKTISQIFPQAVVVPYLTVGGTDTKHYVGLTQHIFRFLPVALKSADLGRMHGRDERIQVDAYRDTVRFYVQLLLNTAGMK